MDNFDKIVTDIIKHTADIIEKKEHTPAEVKANPYLVIMSSTPIRVILFQNHLNPFISAFTYELMIGNGDVWAKNRTAKVINIGPKENCATYYVLPHSERTNQTLIELIDTKQVTDKNMYVVETNIHSPFWFIRKTNPETIQNVL